MQRSRKWLLPGSATGVSAKSVPWKRTLSSTVRPAVKARGLRMAWASEWAAAVAENSGARNAAGSVFPVEPRSACRPEQQAKSKQRRCCAVNSRPAIKHDDALLENLVQRQLAIQVLRLEDAASSGGPGSFCCACAVLVLG